VARVTGPRSCQWAIRRALLSESARTAGTLPTPIPAPEARICPPPHDQAVPPQGWVRAEAHASTEPHRCHDGSDRPRRGPRHAQHAPARGARGRCRVVLVAADVTRAAARTATLGGAPDARTARGPARRARRSCSLSRRVSVVDIGADPFTHRGREFFSMAGRNHPA